MVFCGYGLSIPEYKFDDFAGLDLKGKIVVYIAGGPSNIPGNLRSHYSFRSERWKAICTTAGAIGVVAIANPKAMDIPWARSTLSRASTRRWSWRRVRHARQQFGAVINPAHAEQFFAASGHTFAEIAGAGGSRPSHCRISRCISALRATEQMKTSEVESQNVIGMLPGSDPVLKNEYVVFGAHLDHLGVGAPDQRRPNL